MACKALIYVSNTGTQTVDADSALNLGSILRRYGNDRRRYESDRCGQPSMDLNGNGVTIMETGYYKVDASATISPAAAGSVTLTLLESGVPVPGAVATDTVATAGDSVTLNINTPVIRHMMHCGGKSLTLQISAAGTVSNVSMSVIKEA